MGGNAEVLVESINSRTGIQYNSELSRLSKRMLHRRFKQLTKSFPRLSSIVNLNTELTTDEHELEQDVRPYYKGLKCGAKPYRSAKQALKETFFEIGLGKWHKPPIHVDLFSIQ